MINKIKLLSIVFILFTIFPSKAGNDRLDADGYPYFYVRGQFNSWSYGDSEKFERDGNRYTVHLAELDGEFKVSGSDWEYNLGSVAENEVVKSSRSVDCEQDGHNIKASGLYDVTISFEFSKNASGKGMASTPLHIEAINSESPLQPSGTLPVLYINTYKTDSNGDTVVDDDINAYDLSHKEYFHGDYWLDINNCQWLMELGACSIGSEKEPLPLDIKARGNWTRKGFAKKPFKIKLGSKQNLLALTPEKSKHYALMAHADDSYGYLRNFTGFNLGQRIGLPWTPSQQPVELVLNGDYRGLYFLTESIRIGDGRIEIEDLKDFESEPSLISGGYLVELDNYDEDNQIRMEEKSFVEGQRLDMLRITFDTPEEYSDIQQRFISDQFSAMNDMIGNNNDEIWSYLDLDDAVRYYLVREIISDVEAYHGSTYLFRDRGEGQKWHFSPIWDCGNAFNGSTTEFFYNCDPYGNTWIPSLRANNRFNDKVEETWKWFMSNCYDGLIQDLDDYISHIQEAAKTDRRRWKNVTPPPGGSNVSDNSDITSRRDSAVNHLGKKLNWLTSKFGDFSGNHPEPERDMTPAAALPSYAQNSIEDIFMDSEPSDSPIEYYNLQGQRIPFPAHGQIVIVRKGAKSLKIKYQER